MTGDAIDLDDLQRKCKVCGSIRRRRRQKVIENFAAVRTRKVLIKWLLLT